MSCACWASKQPVADSVAPAIRSDDPAECRDGNVKAAEAEAPAQLTGRQDEGDDDPAPIAGSGPATEQPDRADVCEQPDRADVCGGLREPAPLRLPEQPCQIGRAQPRPNVEKLPPRKFCIISVQP